MKIVGLSTSIAKNKLRLIYLMSLLPIIVIIIVFFYLLTIHKEINPAFWNDFIKINTFGVGLLFIRMIIGIFFQKQIIFSFTGAKEITRIKNPEIYNIVENLCISRGLSVPKIGIIEDNSINAFATGWNPKNSWVVFSRGILDRLNKREIEAVTGHELTHIINGDVKNMVIINVFIGAIGTIGYTLMRIKSNNSRNGNPLALLGLLMYLASIILLPLINLAISRRKEYLADAGSVNLTHDKESMISALEKISKDSAIEQISSKGINISSMFIGDPKVVNLDKKKNNVATLFSSLLSTHPSIESRIYNLKHY